MRAREYFSFVSLEQQKKLEDRKFEERNDHAEFLDDAIARELLATFFDLCSNAARQGLIEDPLDIGIVGDRLRDLAGCLCECDELAKQDFDLGIDTDKAGLTEFITGR